MLCKGCGFESHDDFEVCPKCHLKTTLDSAKEYPPLLQKAFGGTLFLLITILMSAKLLLHFALVLSGEFLMEQ